MKTCLHICNNWCIFQQIVRIRISFPNFSRISCNVRVRNTKVCVEQKYWISKWLLCTCTFHAQRQNAKPKPSWSVSGRLFSCSNLIRIFTTLVKEEMSAEASSNNLEFWNITWFRSASLCVWIACSETSSGYWECFARRERQIASDEFNGWVLVSPLSFGRLRESLMFPVPCIGIVILWMDSSARWVDAVFETDREWPRPHECVLHNPTVCPRSKYFLLVCAHCILARMIVAACRWMFRFQRCQSGFIDSSASENIDKAYAKSVLFQTVNNDYMVRCGTCLSWLTSGWNCYQFTISGVLASWSREDLCECSPWNILFQWKIVVSRYIKRFESCMMKTFAVKI